MLGRGSGRQFHWSIIDGARALGRPIYKEYL